MSETAQITRRAFRIAGTTGDVNNCECCGTAVKKAVRLVPLDAYGNDDGEVYYGTGCAATALSWVTITGKPNTAQRARVTAEAYAAQRRRDDELAWARRVHRRYALVRRLGTIRELAFEYFGNNPHERATGVKASEQVDELLATAAEIFERHRCAP